MPDMSLKSVDVTIVESNAVDRKVVGEVILSTANFGLSINLSAVDPGSSKESESKECDLLLVPYEMVNSVREQFSGNTVVAILTKRSHPELPKESQKIDGFLYREDLSPLSILPWCHLAKERSSK